MAAFCSFSAEAAEKWNRADTFHFIIYSNGNEQQLRDFATEVERFDALLRVRFQRPTPEKPNRLTIYMLSTSAQVGQLLGKGGRNVAGFYHASRNGSYAVANRAIEREQTDLSGKEVLFHEYAHHFMYRDLAYAYPAWFSEGFAEYLSTAIFDKTGKPSLGMPAYHRAYGLVLATKLPISKILFSNVGDLKNGEQREYFYGRSWLLVHWLMSNPDGRDKLGKYLSDFGKGVPPEEAARKNFGDLAELDKSLNKYLETRMSYSRSTDPLTYMSDISIRQLDPVESAVTSLQLQRLVRKDIPTVRAQLAALAKQQPDRKEVWLELARAEIAAGAVRNGAEAVDPMANDDERDKEIEEADLTTLASAEAAIDKALALDTNYGAANILKAEILMQRLSDSNKDDQAMLKLARKHIVRANRADPEDPLPLILWHESHTRFGDTPDQTAHDGLAKAFHLIPEASDVRVRYAYDLARLGQYDDAIAIVQFLASDPHQGAYGKAVLDQLNEMKEKGQKPSAN